MIILLHTFILQVCPIIVQDRDTILLTICVFSGFMKQLLVINHDFL